MAHTEIPNVKKCLNSLKNLPTRIVQAVKTCWVFCIKLVPQNQQKAFDLYKDAANKNEPAALSNVGNAYFSGLVVEKDTIEGLMFLEKSAMQGFPYAQYQLSGLYYYGGKTIQKDVSKGIEWLTLASDQGLPIAQYDLSKIYYHGESGVVASDYNKAKDLCRKAAEQGLPEAKWALENKFNSKNN